MTKQGSDNFSSFMSRVTEIVLCHWIKLWHSMEKLETEPGPASSWFSLLIFPGFIKMVAVELDPPPGFSPLLWFCPISHRISIKILFTQRVWDKGCFWWMHSIAEELELNFIQTGAIASWLRAPFPPLLNWNENMIDFTELLWESREVIHVKAPSQNVMFIIAWAGLELFQEP